MQHNYSLVYNRHSSNSVCVHTCISYTTETKAISTYISAHHSHNLRETVTCKLFPMELKVHVLNTYIPNYATYSAILTLCS